MDMVVSYARQETVEPLRGAARWIAWGLASMTAMSCGMVLFALGLLRLVQDLTGSTFNDTWSFVPYLFAVVFSALVVAGAVSQVRRARL